jgi:phage tail sheath gpL-like
MAAKVDIEVVCGEETGTALAGRFPSALMPQQVTAELINLFSAFGSGQKRARIRLQIDESVGVSATATVTCDQSDGTAGDKLVIGHLPPLTAVASGAVAANGEYSLETSDTAVATSLAAAINAYPPTKELVSATSSSAVVTITHRVKGTVGNSVALRKIVTTSNALVLSAAALSGGIDPGGKRSRTATMSGAWTAADTFTIGGVVLTAASSPSGESQFALGASATAAGANLAAAINAHSKLAGLVSASAATGVVTITLLVGGRIGELITLAEASSACALSGTTFAPTTTDTNSLSYSEFNLGLP